MPLPCIVVTAQVWLLLQVASSTVVATVAVTTGLLQWLQWSNATATRADSLKCSSKQSLVTTVATVGCYYIWSTQLARIRSNTRVNSRFAPVSSPIFAHPARC